jgi:NAD(P)-dependent dehydrogenase (short-subunit alcohol dehydrogenase family)
MQALCSRTAVVTGASRGFGRAIAVRLAEEGYRIALWGRDEDSLAETISQMPEAGRCNSVIAEITDEAQVSQGMIKSRNFLGKIDVLINNAGILGPRGPLEIVQTSEWKNTIEVNLIGMFLVTRAVLPHMKERKYGRIVNIASVAGKDGNPMTSAYSASKAAQIALTKSLSKEVAHDGILVNCVTPSASRTEIFGTLDEAREAELLSRVPLARFVEPHEVAALVSWLSSDSCTFSTGATFDISGGRATW